MIKVSVIGAAGCVGSSIAFNIARQGLADEIMVADIRRDWLEHYAIDFYEAAVANNVDTCVNMGTHEDLAGSNVVVMAAGLPPGTTGDSPGDARAARRRLLPGSLDLVLEWAPAIERYCPGAIVITVTNPAESLNYAAFLLSSGKERRRFLGYSFNDSVRFRVALAAAMKVAPSRLEAVVVGEHGGSMVPLFSSVKLDGRPVVLENDVKVRVRAQMDDYLPRMQRLELPRTSGWLTGVGVARMVNAILNDTGEVFPCCGVLDGEYGFHETSLGVPAALGEGGIREFIEYPLMSEEKELLSRSAANVQKSVDYIKGRIG